MKIYTKQGDQGKTRLVGGECVQKSNPRVECYGSIDELNSSLGVALCSIQDKNTQAELKKIQNQLFNIGSLIACEKTETLKTLPPLDSGQVEWLELQIDKMTELMPVLKNFILPSGTAAASHLHLSRTFCRRAERNLVGLLELQHPPEIIQALNGCLIYLNRLSDYLFVCARYMNFLAHHPDEIWQK